MIKKAFLVMLTSSLIFTGNSLTAGDPGVCTCREFTTTEVVTAGLVIGGVVVLGGVAIAIAAPYAAAAAVIAAPYVVPTTTVGKVGLGLTAAQLARPYVVQTTEEKVHALLKEKASRHSKTKKEFIDCLKSNKHNSPRNASGRPVACEGEALSYAFNSSVPEMNKKTEAFKNNKCFCDGGL